ncbi:sigma factor-like helix-turn-helix DNA-binding protein [Streptomyces sp. NPDC056411]|uniref:sigma factor-like helix-turn-helix DNA-binding protein n=1 Tax=Streptomyces sp. NPDC056411 TaxID=3345813 RepID=UPI0035DF910D
MRERRPERQRRRAQEFESFVAGAAGRLLGAAALLTGEPPSRPAPAAEELLTHALARTYAAWDRLHGQDPYAHTRRELTVRFARTARRHRRPRGGPLDRLSPQERLVVVLRLHEDLAEEQTAAQLGLPTERVRTLSLRALAELRSRRPALEPGRDAAPAPGLPQGQEPRLDQEARPGQEPRPGPAPAAP